MFLCRRYLLIRSHKLLTRNSARYKFSEQPKSTEPLLQKPGFTKTDWIISIGLSVAGLIGYGLYRTRQAGEEGDMPDVEAPIPDHIMTAIEIHGENSIQVADLLKAEAERLNNLEQVEKSVNIAKKALEIYKKVKGPRSNEVADIYGLISMNYLAQTKTHRHDTDQERFDRLWDVAKRYQLQSGEIYLENGNYEQGFDKLEYTAMTFGTTDLKAGEEIFEKIAQLRKEKLGGNDPLAVKTNIRRAMMYTLHNMEEKESELISQIVAEMKKNKIPKENLCLVYQQLGLLYFGKDDIKEGLDATEKAINTMHSSGDQPRVGQLLIQMVAMHPSLKKDSRGAKLYQKFTEKRNKMDKANLEAGNTYRKKAEEQEKKAEYLQAIDNWGRSVEMYEAADKHEQSVYSKIRACSLYGKADKSAQVVDCYENALSLAYKSFGDDHKLTIQCQSILNQHKNDNKKV